jgi:Xaa-Pro aminopeptidase
MGEYRKAGWPDHHMLIGYGVGCWWRQHSCAARARVLEAGMVLALEPHVNFWHVQDMILVKNGAPELLSPKFNTDGPFIAG